MEVGMTDDELDRYMDAAAPLLGLTIRPEWRDGVRANLAVLFTRGSDLLAQDLPDEAEPAPVFRP
jgi:Protein of unknown function (DUF4089)